MLESIITNVWPFVLMMICGFYAQKHLGKKK